MIGGRPFSVMSFTVVADKIVEIDTIADSNRLRALSPAHYRLARRRRFCRRFWQGIRRGPWTIGSNRSVVIDAAMRFSWMNEALNWSTAVCIFAILPLGWVMTNMSTDAPRRADLRAWRETLGLIVLLITEVYSFNSVSFQV